jgi:hypothetical protein
MIEPAASFVKAGKLPQNADFFAETPKFPSNNRIREFRAQAPFYYLLTKRISTIHKNDENAPGFRRMQQWRSIVFLNMLLFGGLPRSIVGYFVRRLIDKRIGLEIWNHQETELGRQNPIAHKKFLKLHHRWISSAP